MRVIPVARDLEFCFVFWPWELRSIFRIKESYVVVSVYDGECQPSEVVQKPNNICWYTRAVRYSQVI